jgi:FkbM family methyltransferase
MNLKDSLRKVVPSSLLGRLRVHRLRCAIARYHPRDVRHCYGGHELTIHLADGLAAGWYDHDWPELTEIKLLRGGGLRPGARVFDLGAHQAVVALMLAREVGPTGHVLAVEASPHNAAIAKRNQQRNAAENLTILQAAVAERSGTLSFGANLNGQVDTGNGAWGRIRVPAFSVDDLAAQHGVPDVLLIDVEGYEAHVLAGAARTLAWRPDCFVEVHANAGLKQFGKSVRRCHRGLCATGHTLLVYPPDGEPQPYSAGHSFLKERFMLVALSGESSPITERCTTL